MQRNHWLWDGPAPIPEHQLGEFSPEQQRYLRQLLSQLGLNIVHEARGPVPLLAFGRRMLEHLDDHEYRVSLPHFADCLKHVIRQMQHDRLQVLSPTDAIGVGYVYNAADPDTWPVRNH